MDEFVFIDFCADKSGNFPVGPCNVRYVQCERGTLWSKVCAPGLGFDEFLKTCVALEAIRSCASPP